MRIDFPSTLSAHLVWTYPDDKAMPDRTPTVVICFGDIPVFNVQPSPEQVAQLDEYSHHREEEEAQLATDVAAAAIRDLFALLMTKEEVPST